ncbi:MAG: hypothetical protein IPK57_15615 [Chitinophagaceae bacterium]|nr:hypothetical protein [Chitinophagaceae bacterium]
MHGWFIDQQHTRKPSEYSKKYHPAMVFPEKKKILAMNNAEVRLYIMAVPNGMCRMQ